MPIPDPQFLQYGSISHSQGKWAVRTPLVGRGPGEEPECEVLALRRDLCGDQGAVQARDKHASCAAWHAETGGLCLLWGNRFLLLGNRFKLSLSGNLWVAAD